MSKECVMITSNCKEYFKEYVSISNTDLVVIDDNLNCNNIDDFNFSKKIYESYDTFIIPDFIDIKNYII